MTRIRTLYRPATESMGERIKARCGDRTLTAAFDYESIKPHEDTAQRLAVAVFGERAKVEFLGQHARGYIYTVREQ